MQRLLPLVELTELIIVVRLVVVIIVLVERAQKLAHGQCRGRASVSVSVSVRGAGLEVRGAPEALLHHHHGAVTMAAGASLGTTVVAASSNARRRSTHVGVSVAVAMPLSAILSSLLLLVLRLLLVCMRWCCNIASPLRCLSDGFALVPYVVAVAVPCGGRGGGLQQRGLGGQHLRGRVGRHVQQSYRRLRQRATSHHGRSIRGAAPTTTTTTAPTDDAARAHAVRAVFVTQSVAVVVRVNVLVVMVAVSCRHPSAARDVIGVLRGRIGPLRCGLLLLLRVASATALFSFVLYFLLCSGCQLWSLSGEPAVLDGLEAGVLLGSETVPGQGPAGLRRHWQVLQGAVGQLVVCVCVCVCGVHRRGPLVILATTTPTTSASASASASSPLSRRLLLLVVVLLLFSVLPATLREPATSVAARHGS